MRASLEIAAAAAATGLTLTLTLTLTPESTSARSRDNFFVVIQDGDIEGDVAGMHRWARNALLEKILMPHDS